MGNIEPVDNSTVDNGGASITEELTQFIEATTTALAETEASEDAVDVVEATGERLTQAIQEATIIDDEDGVTDEQDSDNVEDGDDLNDEQHVDTEQHDEEDDLCQRVSDLEQTFRDGQDHSARERAKNRRRITDVENRLDDLEDRDGAQGSNGRITDAGPSVEPETPLENLASLPTESTQDQRSNVRRALFVARDVLQYTKKVPKGRAITWSELQTVLYAGTDASHPPDVSRTMEVLATFGQDTVELVDRPDRPKLVCFEEEAAQRLDQLCSDTDSANDVVSRAKG